MNDDVMCGGIRSPEDCTRSPIMYVEPWRPSSPTVSERPGSSFSSLRGLPGEGDHLEPSTYWLQVLRTESNMIVNDPDSNMSST